MDDAALSLLSEPSALALYLAAADRPLPQRALARAAGVRAEEAAGKAEALVRAGLLRKEDDAYVATSRHLRERDLAAADGVPLRRAMVRAARAMLDDSERAMHADETAKSGIGVAIVPDREDVLARAAAIVAEAEDQLRALAEEDPGWTGPHVRVMVFLGSLREADDEEDAPR